MSESTGADALAGSSPVPASLPVPATSATHATNATGRDRAASVTRGRVGALLGVRLALSIAVFALALGLVGAGREETLAAERGLYGTLAFSFAVTALHAAILAGIRSEAALRRLAGVQLGTDLAIVTSLVIFTGGSASIFSFLFLPVSVTGAMLFDRWGAYGVSVAASLAFAAAVLVAPSVVGLPAPAREEALAVWGVHTGALLLVALLSSALVAELRLAGERLSESKGEVERLRSLHERIVASLTSGLVTIDHAGRVTSFNPEAESITGRAAGEIAGRPLDDVLPGASAFLETRSSSGRARARMFFEHPEGRRHLGIAASPLRDRAGADGGHVVIFQDVTEVVRMEQELRRSERLAGIGELAAAIAHEIRNPLAAISGSVQILRSGGKAARPEEGERLMSIVLREIERLDGLITDFLAYARPASPKQDVVDLGALLGELLEMNEAAVGSEVSVELELDPECRVWADEAQLRQVFWNLLRNASESMGGPGSVVIGASRVPSQDGRPDDRNAPEESPESVEIHVSDNGPGIPPEVMERMFDPFFTTKKSGTGLGLPTVHRIIEAQGGVLAVESEPGQGASFRITLPAAEAAS